jgi:hypothetical protein
MGFYAKIWKILENCQAIVIQGKVLGTQLTQEVQLNVIIVLQTCLTVTRREPSCLPWALKYAKIGDNCGCKV